MPYKLNLINTEIAPFFRQLYHPVAAAISGMLQLVSQGNRSLQMANHFYIDSFVYPWLRCRDNSTLDITNGLFRWQSH